MTILVSNAVITVNNINIAYVPNSVSYTEGFGEQDVKVQTAGGGATEQIFVENVEMRFSMVKISMYQTPENISAIRGWKSNRNENVITITSDTFSRSFAQATLTSDYEVNLGSDTQIDLEFKTRAAV